MPAAASPPTGSPPQYSPALRWVTTGFGMGPGGASTLSATGTPHPPYRTGGTLLLRHASRDGPSLLSGRPRALHALLHTLSPPTTGRGVLRHFRSGGVRRDRACGPLPLARAAPARPLHRSGVRSENKDDMLTGDPPSTIRTARLQSVARGPPAAYQPGHLPGVLPRKSGDARLGEGFPLRCFQRFARPHVATQRCRSRDNWRTSGASTPVLSY